MKILLFTNYGGCYVTPKMKEIMKDFSLAARNGEVIDYVEKSAIPLSDGYDYEDALKAMKNDPELIYIINPNMGANQYAFHSEEVNYMNTTTFSIVEVDTTRPWTIAEYDGAEYIDYLDKWQLADKELNYYEEIK